VLAINFITNMKRFKVMKRVLKRVLGRFFYRDLAPSHPKHTSTLISHGCNGVFKRNPSGRCQVRVVFHTQNHAPSMPVFMAARPLASIQCPYI